MDPEKRLTNDELVAILTDAERVVMDSDIRDDLWAVAFARVLDYKFTNAHYDRVGGQDGG